ncbi:MAG TPA: hypothetical protein DEA62_02525, partial [Coxiellaceae bacterium]|nr:hypothetical protein [Coxiellaceae bacterium]
MNEVILKIPVDSGVTTEEVSLAYFMPDLDKTVILTPAIKNSEAVFFIGGASEQATAPLRAPSTGDRRVYGFSTFIIYV